MKHASSSIWSKDTGSIRTGAENQNIIPNVSIYLTWGGIQNYITVPVLKKSNNAIIFPPKTWIGLVNHVQPITHIEQIVNSREEEPHIFGSNKYYFNFPFSRKLIASVELKFYMNWFLMLWRIFCWFDVRCQAYWVLSGFLDCQFCSSWYITCTDTFYLQFLDLHTHPYYDN